MRLAQNRRLVQIVPGLPPPATGVGDYALRVAEKLRESHRIETAFLICAPQWRPASYPIPFAVEVLAQRSPASFAAALGRMVERDASVLLQLSPYGYEPNGCPFWLVRGLRSWAGATVHRTLITMFHELYAGGPPWSKAFWLSALQKGALRRVLGCTDVVMTNMRRFGRELQRWDSARSCDIHCLPVPSGVGEPEFVPSIARRSRRACVFGINPGLHPVTEVVAHLMRNAVRYWQIEEIMLIGQSPVLDTFRGAGCRVVAVRNPAADEVSNVLNDCMFGFLWYPETALGKSSVYAAYCAHGVPTALMPTRGNGLLSLDGPKAEEHFVPIAKLAAGCDVQLLQRIADNARDWYRSHSVSVHAGVVAHSMHGKPGEHRPRTA